MEHFPFELRNSADLDVVGFGTNAVDHLVRVAEYPRFNSKVAFSEYTMAAGGEAAHHVHARPPVNVSGLRCAGPSGAASGKF